MIRVRLDKEGKTLKCRSKARLSTSAPCNNVGMGSNSESAKHGHLSLQKRFHSTDGAQFPRDAQGVFHG